MTLLELSVNYRTSVAALQERINQLELREQTLEDAGEQLLLEDRIRILRGILRETRELAVLCEHYYERGTGGMPNTHYRRGKGYAADMAVYARAMSSDNSAQMSRLKRNLVRALREDVTARQRQVLLLYYGERMNMREIGTRLGVNKSTVSRTIKRGERRLQRCLRYGAEVFLNDTE